MKKHILSLAMTILFALLLGVNASAADFVVIVNEGSDLTSVTASDVTKIFLGKSKKIGDSKVTAVDQAADSKVRASFSDKLLGQSVEKVKSYWRKKTFSGKGKAPKALASDEEVIAYVLVYPKAIGYVSVKAVTDDVRVLTVDGQKEW